MNNPARDRSNPSLAVRVADLKASRPDAYGRLARRYAEAILAIEQDGLTRIEDAVDGDVEDELFDLQQELDRLSPPH